MSKKQKKSRMEEELETYSKGETCIPEDAADHILKIIQSHARNITRTKLQYLDEDQQERYSMYANIEVAFDILIDDLHKQGFAI